MPVFSGTPLPRLFALLSICGLLTLEACATREQALAQLPLEHDWTAEDYKYRIGPGDELGLRLILNPDMNSQVTVGADGRGIFPLVGPVPIAGLTVEEATAMLTKNYGAYLRNPATEMLIYNYASAQVFVAGEVKLPGARQVRGTMTVAQVINDSGGFLPTAGMNNVVLLRHRRDGRVLMRKVNVLALYKGKSDEDIRVLPGDVVFVPRSGG